MVSSTSLDVWYKKVKPNISQAQEAFILALENIGKPCKAEDVAKHLRKFPHEISGRVSELLKAELIEIVGREKNDKGNYCYLLQIKKQPIVSENNQLNLF